MVEEIEKELQEQCDKCKKNECEMMECFIYRIKQYIQFNEEDTKFNIDDFFEKEDKNQMTIFDMEE